MEAILDTPVPAKVKARGNGLKKCRSCQFREIAGTYEANELSASIRDAIEKRHDYVVLDGNLTHVNCVKLRLFAYNARKCVVCGRTADRYVLERLDPNSQGPHLNLYGKRADGSDLLFTRDHVLPKSLSGSDALFNMQVMCKDCNLEKGHRIRKEDVALIIRQIRNGQASLPAIAKAWLSWYRKTLKSRVFQTKTSKAAKARRKAASKYYSDVFDAISVPVGYLTTKADFIEGHIPKPGRAAAHKWKFYADRSGTVIYFRRSWRDVVCLRNGEPIQSAVVDSINRELKRIEKAHAGKGFIKGEK